MAVTSLWAVKTRLSRTIDYVKNPEKTMNKTELDPDSLTALKDVIEYAEDGFKTEEGMFVTGINCRVDQVYKDFMLTKELYGKTGGRLAYHGYQSFKEGDGKITAELAHEIGVKLAEELWGDRFEVVVATHLNTGHYHNHFVLNSVSFADGYKFTRTIADYQKMREVSDRLCREYHLITVDNPRHKRMPYSEWQDSKMNKPTIRSRIREDIDNAIKVSYTQRQFAKVMKEMGYEFKLETKDGYPLKYPGLMPPGSEKYIRFRSLGPGYELEEILKKILKNNLVSGMPEIKVNASDYKNTDCVFRRKYFIFTATINRYVKRNQSFEYIPMAIREDVYKLEEYRIRTDFLYKNNLQTIEQVEAKKQVRERELEELTKRCKHLYYELGLIENKTDPKCQDIKSEIRSIRKDMKRLNTEIKVCEEILDTSTKVEDFFDSKYKDKEVKKQNVSRNRNIRTGRKNGTARD